jgi:hypothetical protein
MKGSRYFAGMLLIVTASVAQTAEPAMYAESFRHGATHVTEDAFEVKLNPGNAFYRERIKDSRGEDRYEMTVTPHVLVGSNQVTLWEVKLADLRHRIYSNVLVAEQEPSAEARNNLWRLDPNRFSPVPIRARRIMKVDEFYVVIQVKDLHFTPLDSPYLDSMAVQFAFTNSDPRASH